MQHRDAIKRIGALFHRAEPDTDPDAFSGPSLLDQEPDLAQENARHNMTASAWAAGGQPSE